MNALTIANHSIRTSGDLYSLNDLHKSSGGNAKHQPANFMRNEQTQELIHAIEEEGSVAYHTIRGGNAKQQGTFVCRELVYAYAMWISAKFHLMVIRAFDALNTGAISCLSNHQGLSVCQAATLQKAVKAKCRYDRRHYQRLYNALYDEFGVKSYKDILPEDFETAMDFIQAFRFDEHEELARSAELLAWHTKHIYDWYKQIEHPLRAIAPQLSAQVHDHIIYANGYAGQVGRRLAMTR
ncbi:KilA-N domain-containing protein [Moraxella nasibovis]|uniref:KilA-N domain-containing protein n=1 Tax=Moraxella nasibovis TaxID=2904120 RepID=UPI00240EEE0E|nr:KilA-N domain-containing protein [Moraxella nasibovis]WFF38039.1 KilA-N domain-containing protein [Moraxella nasibovis]